MPTKKPDPYHAYLLRCWQEQITTADEPAIWRFVLIEIGGEQTRRAFPSLEAMVSFLQTALNEAEESEQQTTKYFRMR